MRWKNSGLPDEFSRAHPRLQALAMYMDHYAIKTLGKDLFVTDVERTQEEYDLLYGQTPYRGPMPHLGPPSRAIDFRTVGELTDAQVKGLTDHVNSFWVRSDGRLTAMHHAVGDSPAHLHCQVVVI